MALADCSSSVAASWIIHPPAGVDAGFVAGKGSALATTVASEVLAVAAGAGPNFQRSVADGVVAEPPVAEATAARAIGASGAFRRTGAMAAVVTGGRSSAISTFGAG